MHAELQSPELCRVRAITAFTVLPADAASWASFPKPKANATVWPPHWPEAAIGCNPSALCPIRSANTSTHRT